MSDETPAYLFADIGVHDPVRYEEYRKAVPAIIAKHGGSYVVRGAEVEVVEGDWRPRRFVVLRFPSRRALQAMLDDPAYQPLKAMRHAAADSNIVVADGFGG